MPPEPAHADPGAQPAWEPVITCPDPMTQEELEAWLGADEEEPSDPEEWLDPEGPPPPGEDELTAAEIAAVREAAADEGLAVEAALAGRRGPGQPGSARRLPGESSSPAAAFGSGMALDVLAGCVELAAFAEKAAGPADSYHGVSDNELVGVLCAWDRAEAHIAARKYAAMAELIRRRPDPECPAKNLAQMPEAYEEFTADELALALAESRARANEMLTVTLALEVKLPATKAALRDGIISSFKAWIIACAVTALTPEEARRAEAMVLGRAGRLTPGGLRAAIARAVVEAAPDKAKKRREDAARDARVQRWAEDSGNAALMGRELPPAEVLAADQRITAWAEQLRRAGLEGSMDELRARAYLDILLGKDSRPRQDSSPGSDDPGRDDPGHTARAGQPPAPPVPGTVPAGFGGRVNLIVPLATLLGLAVRPGELPGLGPVDPGLARDLADAAARDPRSAWCVTVTDAQGHALGHGCARPERKREPGGTRDGPGFAFTARDGHGPPGGYGTWRLRTGGPGPDMIIDLDPVTTGSCDHRFEASGHDPGVRLRHLAQVRHAACTAPTCRRPAAACDFEHNIPYEAGGRTCLCNGGPKCRHDHRLKQHSKWAVDQRPDGAFVWTTPSGRQYETEPTRYPV